MPQRRASRVYESAKPLQVLHRSLFCAVAQTTSDSQRNTRLSPTAGLKNSVSCEERGCSDSWSLLLRREFAKHIEQAVTGSLSQGCAEKSKSGAILGSTTDTPPFTNDTMLSALSLLISRQNLALERLQDNIIHARLKENEEQKASSPTYADLSGLAPHSTVLNSKESICETDDLLENTIVATALQSLLVPAQIRWQEFLYRHMDKTRELHDDNEGSSQLMTSESQTVGMGLPTAAELLESLMDGLNSEETRQVVVKKWGIELCDSGIDPYGLTTVFRSHIQVLGKYPSIVPGLRQLRHYFAALNPERMRSVPDATNRNWLLGLSLVTLEDQLNRLLQDENNLHVTAILLEGVHPFLRRLVYARALGLRLFVTDGSDACLDVSSSYYNCSTSAVPLPTYLTCASKNARDVLRRSHARSSVSKIPKRDFTLLQSLMRHDVSSFVGDNDNYFNYVEDTELLATTMVGNRRLPKMFIQKVLTQLGRVRNSQEDVSCVGYTVRLPKSECAMEPARTVSTLSRIASSSLVIAPFGNLTGDIVEQYELATAIFSQVWARVQGPSPELFQCCLIFEKLLEECAPSAAIHAAHLLQGSPLIFLLSWISNGFAELLDPVEVLLLWDWLLAYHVKEMQRRSALSSTTGLPSSFDHYSEPSETQDEDDGNGKDHKSAIPCALWLLPVMAASLIAFRAPLILKCETRNELESLFVSARHIRCRFLIQSFLFTNMLHGREA